MPETPVLTTSVAVNGELQARVGKALRITGLVLLIVGAILLLGYIALSTTLETLAEEGRFEMTNALSVGLYVPLILGAILLVVGIVFFVASRTQMKEANRIPQENVYTFYETHVIISSVRNAEVIGTVKCYYSDFFRVRRAGDLLLMYPNSVTAYAVDLRRLSKEEDASLFRLLADKLK